VVELLKEIALGVAKVVMLFNPPTATFVGAYLNPFKAAADARDMEALVSLVHDMREVELLLTTQAREPNSGLVVMPDAFTVSRSTEIISLAARFRVPAVYWSRSFAELGGLISYGPYIVDEFRRAASYADRILKGEKPADLPVQPLHKANAFACDSANARARLQIDWGVTWSAMALVGLESTSKNRLAEALK
jgi:putative ABC transport system substrate-binding protein